MIYSAAFLACAMALRGGQFDVIFCDLVAHLIPVLRLCQRSRIVFYCNRLETILRDVVEARC